MKKVLFFLVGFVSAIIAQDSTQTFLSLRNTAVEKFQNEHPDYDGRGTIVMILDTGVDMGVDGLKKTSTGEVKVIDVRDFTGQGDIKFYEAEIDDEDGKEFFINEEKQYKVFGANKLSMKSVDGNYFIGNLPEKLWLNSGSRASDINGNGVKTDNFYFVTFKAISDGEEFWVVYIDLNNNSDLSDEDPIRNYKENFDSFYIPNEKGLPYFTMALNIFPEKKIVNFYFDDGSHGTHCAGISTGYRIGDNELYGIAPGANLMGLKLGNNNFAGGATVAESMKKAYLYADKISKEREEPCIINMSFGIGSEIEGKADIEEFLRDLVKNNPYLYISTSNGNEGPGISTSGMPAASNSIFSTGAVLAQEVGNDLYGTTLDRDIILHFSSRGGEVSKPDVVAPGACVSTVPNFSRGDRFWGTSMASPYSAGVMSVLLGAMKVEYPEVKIPSQFLYKVLRESAIPMEGYSTIDQGAGLINIENAYRLLKKYIKNGELKNFETYSISSFAPNMPNNSAPNLYIRDASYLTGNEKFSFKVKRNNTIDKNKFYRIFNIKSNADWLKPIEKKIHIRNNQSANIDVIIADSILNKPGMYNAQIRALRADAKATPEFNCMATIVVPYEFNNANDYKLYFEDKTVEPGMHHRYFVKVPANASNLNIEVQSPKGKFTSVRYYLHDPDGRKKYFGYLNSKNDEDSKTIYFDDIQAGVYEFVILGQFTSSKKSKYNVSFEIDGINLLGHSIINGTITFRNSIPKIKSYTLSGKILGYQKKYKVKMNGEKIYEIPFKLKAGEKEKSFDVILSKEVFNKVTDFALMIYDENGKSLRAGGLSYREGNLKYSRDDTSKEEIFRFVLVPAFANKPSEVEFDVVEKTFLENEKGVEMKINNRNRVIFYPDIEYKINCEFELPGEKLDKDETYIAELLFKSTKTDDVEFSKIVKIIN